MKHFLCVIVENFCLQLLRTTKQSVRHRGSTMTYFLLTIMLRLCDQLPKHQSGLIIEVYRSINDVKNELAALKKDMIFLKVGMIVIIALEATKSN